MKSLSPRWFILAVLMWVLSGCSDSVGSEGMTFTRLHDLSEDKLNAVSSKSYFFGHQSVGRNMLDGLRMVMEDNPTLKLDIRNSESVSNVAPGAFLHSNVGKNRFPQTKIDQYQSALEGGLGNSVDAAFLKFCYVDLANENDPVELFQTYKASVEALKLKYPETRFVHFTLPLKSVPTGLKVSVKNLIGKEIPQQMDNIKRAQYNELLREAYVGVDPVFDIARYESIDPATGEAFTFKYDGKEYEAMSPGNTYDGGHLSDKGKRWIAEQLIVFLASLD